jgi:deazaflavin-dependent oxidoreductase (nitroreductase family)
MAVPHHTVTLNGYESEDGKRLMGIWESSAGVWKVDYKDWEYSLRQAGPDFIGIYSRMCNMANVNGFFAEVAAQIKEHLQTYIKTDGKEGYYRDLSGAPGGGDPKSITLILRTRGRKSGETRLTPLLYNHWKDEFVIVASKAGADEHPAWFLNMTAAKAVDVQIKNRRYRCTWRVSEGAERAKIWPFMVGYYPPFHAYQARTQREIPVVVLTPVEEIEEKFELGSSAGVDARSDSQMARGT